MKANPIHAALDRLARAEAAALATEFVAPAVRGGGVLVRVAGIVCKMRIRPRGFEGWGLFRPLSHSEAALARPATLTERKAYLGLFPSWTLILVGRQGRRWLASAAHQAEARIRAEGLVPVDLVEESQAFDAIRARFDGSRALFESPDPRHDPAAGAYLREALGRMVAPGELARPGLTAAERAAYELAYRPRFEATEAARRDRDEERLRRALDHAGARLLDVLGRDDVFRVTFEVDGERTVSTVSRRDLTVQSAGLCLAGEDRRFDLQSLVGVIREGRGLGAILPIGVDNGGMPEEHYWDIHSDGE